MTDAIIQTSLKSESKKKSSDPPKSARNELVVEHEPKIEVPPQESIESVSPQKRIDLQLQEIERQQRHDGQLLRLRYEAHLRIVSKTLKSKILQNLQSAFFQIARKAESVEVARLTEKLKTIDMSATMHSGFTRDRTQMGWG